MTPFDASKRAVARQANARALVDTLAVLEQHHGTPCRDGLPVFPLERRWCAQGRNRLFSDRAPATVFASTYAVAVQQATEQGLHRPLVAVTCDRCGHRLGVVDPAKADRAMLYHQSTEKCFYHAMLCALVWRGFAPVDGVPCAYTAEQLEALAAVVGPGNARDTKRMWAPLPRVLARLDRAFRALDCGAELTDSDYRALEDLDTLTRWERIALQWSANLVQLDASNVQNATDIHSYFAAKIASEQATATTWWTRPPKRNASK